MMAKEGDWTGFGPGAAARRKLVAIQFGQFFMEKGYARTSIAEIAARSGISKKTFYRLFPNKLSVFAAAIEVHRDRLFRLPQGDDLPLHIALESAFRVDLDPGEIGATMGFFRRAMFETLRNMEIATVFHDCCVEKIHIDLTNWLYRQHRLGRITIDDVGGRADMLLNMIFGMIILGAGGEFDRIYGLDRSSYIRFGVEIFLRGLTMRHKEIWASADKL